MFRIKPVSEIYYEFEIELVNFLRENHSEDLNLDDLPKKNYNNILKFTFNLIYDEYKDVVVYKDLHWFKILSVLEGLPKDFKSLIDKKKNYITSNIECSSREVYDLESLPVSGEVKEEIYVALKEM